MITDNLYQFIKAEDIKTVYLISFRRSKDGHRVNDLLLNTLLKVNVIKNRVYSLCGTIDEYKKKYIASSGRIYMYFTMPVKKGVFQDVSMLPEGLISLDIDTKDFSKVSELLEEIDAFYPDRTIFYSQTPNGYHILLKIYSKDIPIIKQIKERFSHLIDAITIPSIVL